MPWKIEPDLPVGSLAGKSASTTVFTIPDLYNSLAILSKQARNSRAPTWNNAECCTHIKHGGCTCAALTEIALDSAVKWRMQHGWLQQLKEKGAHAAAAPSRTSGRQIWTSTDVMCRHFKQSTPLYAFKLSLGLADSTWIWILFFCLAHCQLQLSSCVKEMLFSAPHSPFCLLCNPALALPYLVHCVKNLTINANKTHCCTMHFQSHCEVKSLGRPTRC